MKHKNINNLDERHVRHSLWHYFGDVFCLLLCIGVAFLAFFYRPSSVKADYFPNEFVTTWKTDNPGTSSSDQITIPTTGGGYNYNVAWEEVGNPSNNGVAGPFVGSTTLAFPSAGTYEVRITGDFPRIYFSGSGDSQKILTVEWWGSNQWSSMSYAFHGASNLQIPAPDAPNLTNVTDMSYMFYGATALNSDLSSWGVGNVTNMSAMFAGATSFNQPLSSWNVGNVTNMSAMFASATSFNQPLDSWNVGNVTNMTWMFASATSFNQPLDSWNVGSVTSLPGIFSGATSFNQPLNNWNVGNITDMLGMFAGATSFNQPLNNWNVGNVTNMGNMFYSATSFNQSLSDWNVSSVTDMSNMFRSATNFNQPLNNWNVSNVTNMSRMFQDAKNFNQPLNSWNVSNVTNMTAVFYNATLFNQPLGSWNVANATDVAYIIGLTGVSPANYDNLLEGWSKLPLKRSLIFWSPGVGYCAAGASRTYIRSMFAWQIADAGNFCPPNIEIVTKNLSKTQFRQNSYLSITVETNNAFNGRATFSVVDGKLPNGVFLTDLGSGRVLIAGTPKNQGTFTFTLKADDGNSVAAYTYTIIVLPAVSGAALVSDSSGIKRNEERPTRNPVRRVVEGEVQAASLVEEGIFGLSRSLGISPQTVVNTAPWLIIILLLIFTLIVFLRIIQQVVRLIAIRRIADRQMLINHEKRSLLTLATHYLRTPLTLISADTEQLPEGHNQFKVVVNYLKLAIDKLIADIELDQNAESTNKPEETKIKREPIVQRRVLIPIAVTLAMIVAVNTLFFTATSFSPAIINVGAQILGMMVVSSLFYVSFDQYRQRKLLKAHQTELLLYQEKLDGARNQFIEGIISGLVPAVKATRKAAPNNLPSEKTKHIFIGLEQLEQLTENFTLISQLERKKLEEHHDDVSLLKLFRKIKKSNAKPDELTLDIKPGLSVKQPAFLLEKVFSSIADNAVAHNKEDMSAQVRVRGGRKNVTVDIQDYGEGISEEKLSLLFKPMSRVEGAEDFTHQGMGLSLYIDQLIMHYLGGDISISSKLDKGTTVHVEVPRFMAKAAQA